MIWKLSAARDRNPQYQSEHVDRITKLLCPDIWHARQRNVMLNRIDHPRSSVGNASRVKQNAARNAIRAAELPRQSLFRNVWHRVICKARLSSCFREHQMHKFV